MEQKNNDLRDALRRVESDMPLQSDDFAERLSRQIAPRTSNLWRQVAAVFLGLLIVSGLTLAAIRLVRPSQPSPQPRLVGGDSIAANRTEANEKQAVRFENARLDSVLAVVAAHYGCAVSFIDEQPRRLRLSTTWQPARPLSDFTSLMNELNGLHLTVNGDTIVVSGKPTPTPSRGEGRK